jgi:cellobiose transport system permease protein
MVDWRWTGYNALIYLAAMQSVPRDLYPLVL